MMYRGAGILLVSNHKNKTEVLLGKRRINPNNGSWSIPGGKAEANETSYSAATRELKEEIGLRFKKTSKRPKMVYIGKTVINLFFFRYKIFVMELTQRPDRMFVKPPKEFSQLAWFPIDKLPPNTHFGVLEAIRTTPFFTQKKGEAV